MFIFLQLLPLDRQKNLKSWLPALWSKIKTHKKLKRMLNLIWHTKRAYFLFDRIFFIILKKEVFVFTDLCVDQIYVVSFALWNSWLLLLIFFMYIYEFHMMCCWCSKFTQFVLCFCAFEFNILSEQLYENIILTEDCFLSFSLPDSCSMCDCGERSCEDFHPSLAATMKEFSDADTITTDVWWMCDWWWTQCRLHPSEAEQTMFTQSLRPV